MRTRSLDFSAESALKTVHEKHNKDLQKQGGVQKRRKKTQLPPCSVIQPLAGGHTGKLTDAQTATAVPICVTYTLSTGCVLQTWAVKSSGGALTVA